MKPTIDIVRSNRTGMLVCTCTNCGATAARISELFAQHWAEKHICRPPCLACGYTHPGCTPFPDDDSARDRGTEAAL